MTLTHKSTKTPRPPLFINNTQIQQVHQHTYLGVTLDEYCSWSKHIEYTKTWKRLDILRSLKLKLDRKTLEIMYFSFIRPLLEYSDIVWGNCNQRDTNDLEKYKLKQVELSPGQRSLHQHQKYYGKQGGKH